jgi:hypothetical protein
MQLVVADTGPLNYLVLTGDVVVAGSSRRCPWSG